MYEFRVEEGQTGAGDIVSVDFATMMGAKDGFLVLKDGRTAKRINRPSSKSRTSKDPSQNFGAGLKIVSDAMGFADNQLADMERDRVANGFTGVEFRQDPTEPRFYQVLCSSERVKSEYMRHRGFTDRNSKNGSGSIVDAGQIEQARKRVIEQFGNGPSESGVVK